MKLSMFCWQRICAVTSLTAARLTTLASMSVIFNCLSSPTCVNVFHLSAFSLCYCEHWTSDVKRRGTTSLTVHIWCCVGCLLRLSCMAILSAVDNFRTCLLAMIRKHSKPSSITSFRFVQAHTIWFIRVWKNWGFSADHPGRSGGRGPGMQTSGAKPQDMSITRPGKLDRFKSYAPGQRKLVILWFKHGSSLSRCPTNTPTTTSPAMLLYSICRMKPPQRLRHWLMDVYFKSRAMFMTYCSSCHIDGKWLECG